MAKREIIIGEEPILRGAGESVSEYGEELHQLLQDLTDTMQNANGFGLAAPQIGVAKQVCVIDIGEGMLELINPQITEREGTQRGMEGCLSFPGVSLEVERPAKICVAANDRYGAPIQLEAQGLLARTICHEVDHLHGVLFFDRVEEADFFAQFMQQVAGFDQAGGNVQQIGELEQHAGDPIPETGDAMPGVAPGGAGEVADSVDDPVRRAIQKELQMIVDLLADASWKTELALDMVQAYPKLAQKHAGYVRKLQKIAKQLGQQADDWEKHCESAEEWR